MPRLPIDYSKTVIYKIVANDLNITECYVGSTTDFTRRKQNHKSNCTNEKGKNYNVKLYATIRDNGGWDNYSMVEIEKYPCRDANEACAKEREWFERSNSGLNTNRPQRTDEEQKIKYREIEKRRLYKRDWAREKVLTNKIVEPTVTPESTLCIQFYRMKQLKEAHNLTAFAYWIMKMRRANTEFMNRYGKYKSMDRVVQ